MLRQPRPGRAEASILGGERTSFIMQRITEGGFGVAGVLEEARTCQEHVGTKVEEARSCQMYKEIKVEDARTCQKHIGTKDEDGRTCQELLGTKVEVDGALWSVLGLSKRELDLEGTLFR